MRLAIVVTVVACWPFMATAQQSGESDISSKVIALENAWSRASETKDLKALDGLLDEGFFYVDLTGRLMTKAEVLKDVKESAVAQVITESMVTHLHGGTVMVVGSFRMKGIEGGKPFLRRGRFVDTWLYKNGSWVCIASAGIPITP